MTGRIHHVTGPRRRRAGGGLSRYTVSVGVQNTCTATWRPESFGPLADPWLPSDGSGSPESKLGYLVLLASAHLRQISGGAWDCHLDDAHAPHALVMTKPGDTAVLPLAVEGRSIRVGRVPVSMATAGVGVRVLELVASRVGAFFGEVA